MTPVRNANEQAVEAIDIPTTETAKLRDERDATNVDELETEPEPISHHINELTTATIVDEEKATTMEMTNTVIETQTNIDEIVTAPEEAIKVPPVPIHSYCSRHCPTSPTHDGRDRECSRRTAHRTASCANGGRD
jgi:hypothetical protein